MELQGGTKQCDHPTDGTVAPCFPMYSASFNWGNIDDFTFDDDQLNYMKKTCEKHCFSTLKSQPRVLLQRCARNQMDVGEREARIPRRRPQLRGLMKNSSGY
jgi:hypothetical protein